MLIRLITLPALPVPRPGRDREVRHAWKKLVPIIFQKINTSAVPASQVWARDCAYLETLKGPQIQVNHWLSC
jgi:hypothetical protein